MSRPLKLKVTGTARFDGFPTPRSRVYKGCLRGRTANVSPLTVGGDRLIYLAANKAQPRGSRRMFTVLDYRSGGRRYHCALIFLRKIEVWA